MEDSRPIGEIVEDALETIAQKWEWRAQMYVSAGQLDQAAKLMDDAEALRGHVGTRR